MPAKLMLIGALASAILVAPPVNAAPPDPAQNNSVEVVGCLDGSVLTENSLNYESKGRQSGNSAVRWRLSASKRVMAQIRELADRELRVVGTTDTRQRGTRVLDRQVGKKGRVYVGARSRTPDRA
jgi:hypothetical protein